MPELFATQFQMVVKDKNVNPKQSDPCDLVHYFNLYKSMKREKKVPPFLKNNSNENMFVREADKLYHILFRKETKDGVTMTFAFDKVCDIFARYISIIYFLGIAACPTVVFCSLLAKPPNNRPGYNSRRFVPGRVEVSYV